MGLCPPQRPFLILTHPAQDISPRKIRLAWLGSHKLSLVKRLGSFDWHLWHRDRECQRKSGMLGTGEEKRDLGLEERKDSTTKVLETFYDTLLKYLPWGF